MVVGQFDCGSRRVTPAMAAGVTDKLWEVSDIVAMLEQWELANFKPEYQFRAPTVRNREGAFRKRHVARWPSRYDLRI
jgi:hypothetical protein